MNGLLPAGLGILVALAVIWLFERTRLGTPTPDELLIRQVLDLCVRREKVTVREALAAMEALERMVLRIRQLETEGTKERRWRSKGA